MPHERLGSVHLTLPLGIVRSSWSPRAPAALTREKAAEHPVDVAEVAFVCWVDFVAHGSFDRCARSTV